MNQFTQQRQFVSTISSKGQITIPVAVRRHLNLAVLDKVVLSIDKNKSATIEPLQFATLDDLQGAAGSLKKPLSLAKMKQIAYEDRHIKNNP
jgi:AbrB family looped-hinge helix DNA binding protein